MRFHRDFGVAIFDPHRKAGGVMVERTGFVVIYILSVSDAVMQRLDMGIVHGLRCKIGMTRNA
jgi:hypothetical protein